MDGTAKKLLVITFYMPLYQHINSPLLYRNMFAHKLKKYWFISEAK